MASFTMSTARLAAPAKVSGLGFRKAISAVRFAAKPAPVASKAVAMTVWKTKAKPGHGKAKTNKSAAKRFKITASGKVRSGNTHIRGSRRARARGARARAARRRANARAQASPMPDEPPVTMTTFFSVPGMRKGFLWARDREKGVRALFRLRPSPKKGVRALFLYGLGIA